MESAQGSEEERVAAAIEAHDEIRRDLYGGWGFSQYRIERGAVYLATTDHDNEPLLVILPVAEFLAQWEVAEEEGR